MLSREMAAENKLRDDFEIYKTQVAICGWCGLVVIMILIGALIYAFFLIRKIRKQFDVRINTLEATRRFTINRPKVYSSSDPTSKLQGEIERALSIEDKNSNKEISRGQPSPSPSPLSPSPLSPISGPNIPYQNPNYRNLNSPGLTSLYSNLNSPHPNTPNINLRTPSANSSDRSNNRIENFLNRTRQLYSQSSDASPRLSRTPNNKDRNRDGDVFQFN